VIAPSLIPIKPFHAVIGPGCTSNRFASSASVPSFRTAARATFALNSGA